ncbi:MAG: LysM peptidoglycan-binding domain-containing protein [Phycisphaerae bacterium]|nr:LysM peptidoglycan-binding domain-containing protein [Phycisphaerae bacterium]
MTREVKLSLILGFAVVLSVALLLSDHFSGAQQARQAGMNPERGIEPVTTYAPAPEPTLILVDEQGRPQQPARPTQPAPRPGDPRQKSIMPTVVANADGPQPVPVEQSTLLNRLRDRFADGVQNAVNDLGNGHTPPPAVATNEPVRFDEPQPIDPNAGTIESFASNEPESEPAPQPVESNPRKDRFATYEVQEGDTLWSIASKQLGSGSRHAEIAALNQDRMGKGNTLRVGTSLRLPSEAAPEPTARNDAKKSSEKERQASKTAPKRDAVDPAPTAKKKNGKTVYTVKSGDTLGAIAARYLGSSSKYDDLLLANADTLKDENSLEVGMELMIPGR